MINMEVVSTDTCNEPYSIKFFLHQASSPDQDTFIYLAAALFMYEYVCVHAPGLFNNISVIASQF